MLDADHVMPFADYLKRALASAPRPVHWPHATLATELADTDHGERGSLALVADTTGAPEIAPGVSAALQVVTDRTTSPHAHAFWHVYVVQRGCGTATLGQGNPADTRSLNQGDVLYVPPWCMHSFCAEAGQTMTLLALQNLPQLAGLGTLVRCEKNGEPQLVYADDVRPL